MSTPDLCIIDYSVGLPGSQHDATAFSETRVCKEHNVLLDEEEWILLIRHTHFILGARLHIKSEWSLTGKKLIPC